MLRRLASRLRRLEQARTLDELPGEGLAAILAYAERHHLRPTPITNCTDAELDTRIEALNAHMAAGARGGAPLLLEALEQERARRQAALAQESPA